MIDCATARHLRHLELVAAFAAPSPRSFLVAMSASEQDRFWLEALGRLAAPDFRLDPWDAFVVATRAGHALPMARSDDEVDDGSEGAPRAAAEACAQGAGQRR